MAVRLSVAAVEGTQRLEVGTAVYALPKGSTVVMVENDRLAWTFSPSGDVSAYVQGGEVQVPGPLQQLVRNKIFGAP